MGRVRYLERVLALLCDAIRDSPMTLVLAEYNAARAALAYKPAGREDRDPNDNRPDNG
jgi:hypothetical protein